MKKTILFLALLQTAYSGTAYKFSYVIHKNEFCTYGYYMKQKNKKSLLITRSYHLAENSYKDAKIDFELKSPIINQNAFSISDLAIYASNDSEYRFFFSEKNEKLENGSVFITTNIPIEIQLGKSIRENEIKTSTFEAWILPVFLTKDDTQYYFIFTKGTFQEMKKYLLNHTDSSDNLKTISSPEKIQEFFTKEPDEYMKQRKAFKEKQAKEQQQAEQLQRQKDEEALKHEE